MDELTKKKLLLPKTSFPIHVNLEIYKQIILKWEKEQIYSKVLLKNKTKPVFFLHDGPIYANGSVHLGHILNHVLKDIVVRFYSINDFCTPYIMGWDTHGLPIENKALCFLGIQEKTQKHNNILKIRSACHDFALKNVEIQREELKKIGKFTDYQNFYLTLDNRYEAEQLRIFKKMVEKKLIFRDYRPIHWSCESQTALAENEIEYFEKKDTSLFFNLS